MNSLPNTCDTFVQVFPLMPVRFSSFYPIVIITVCPINLGEQLGAVLTFLQGLGDTLKDAMNCFLWADVRMVLGLLGPRLPSRGLEPSSTIKSSPRGPAEGTNKTISDAYRH